ncbi:MULTISPECIES: hypothetical protein [Thermomonas]|uniref:Uncharacterized protein n=1 Tax=Thermomonas beijingensis TaxID=2872701 RepID=A0ABS7TBF8_9GAMM|nr:MULTISPECIES: hypothetical protein [Thermomonas]MBZ4185172.1 hypothetical protein [Thermomonas beijingensis]HOC10695.1 hypothetical protein [Thermomonas sp.]HQA02767.1 hypothetical protein [Thermomonas sp.]HQE08591.1 hypothetical protein [Thermomonas sp.]
MNTRLPEVRINKRAERPRRYAPDISGTDEALPRDISLSGEHEALPAPLFATLQKLTFPQGSCILTDLILALQAVFANRPNSPAFMPEARQRWASCRTDIRLAGRA